MKKFIIMLVLLLSVAILSTSCADRKTFTQPDGTTIVVEPYGLFNQSKRNNNVEYDVSTGNVVLSVIFSESIIIPVWLVGTELWEPVELKTCNNGSSYD